MALALRLFLLLLLAVALHARAAQAAPVPARGADEGAGNSFSAAWLEGGLDSLGSPAGVSTGRTFPASGLVPPHKARSHRRGPPRGRNRSPGDKPSQEALELLDQMLSKLQRRRDEDTGNASPAAWMEDVLGPLGSPAGVSAGRTFPAPRLVAPQWSSSHRRGPPRGRNQPPQDKPSQEARDLLDQMLNELERRRDEDTGNASPAAWMEDALGPLGSPAGVSAGRTFPAPLLIPLHKPSSHHREMDQGAVQKLMFPEGSSGSVPGSAEGREAMPGTGTRDGDHYLDYLQVLVDDALSFLEQPAGVSAQRTFPAPELIPLHKRNSHGRGPPKVKSETEGDKDFLESNEVLREIVKELMRGREMDQGALWQAAFSKGSSGSVPGSAEGREVMPGTGTRDEGAGNASPLDWLREVLEPLQPPAVIGVSAGRTFPAPLLVVPYKLNSHHRGPPGGKSQPPGGKKSQEPSEGMRQMLKEMMQGVPEMDQGTLWQAPFPIGSSGSVPGSAEGREAMPGTGTRDEGAGNASPLDWLHEVLEPLMSPAGVSAGRTFPAPLLVVPHKPSSHGRGPPRGKNQPPGEKKSQEPSEGMREILKEPGRGQDAAGATTRAPKVQESTGRDFCRGTRCLIVIMASMLGGLLAIMSCCAAIWYWRVRKRLLSAPAPEQPNTSARKSWTSHPHSLYPCSAALPRLQHLLFDVKVQLPPKRSSLPLNPLIAPYDED
ncbi:uncharacterized protein LOC116792429 [Chiroxiphia lanceolata]|uniref:uncharacterized protein LOC116792429 n=1 Tax=Chiroxiphia lanceolata TaxID=296741 RepID=UPI0013CEF1A4|nr:uncharacterized protein LOC116792429 [Chiroxiphia lanceolata]